MNTKTYSILLAAAFLLPSCEVKYDMVSYSSAGTMPAVKTPVPGIEIHTNTTVSSLMGGDVKSKKPYHIHAYYIDDTFTFASAEFTKVTVTYTDGSTDPGAAALKLPMTFKYRPYETSNSMADGVVVVKKSRIIVAELPATISRDESFILIIEGSFTKDNGTTIPFKIKERYNISREKRTESWADFVSSC